MAFDPGIAIATLDDLVGNEAFVFLRHRIAVGAADEALDGKEGVLRIGYRLALRRLADKAFVIIGEGDDGGCRSRTFRVLNHFPARTFHHCDAGIGGAEVDTDDLTHNLILTVAADKTGLR